jgi:hypothetical protein
MSTRAKLCMVRNGSAAQQNKVGLGGHSCVCAATGWTGNHISSAPRVCACRSVCACKMPAAQSWRQHITDGMCTTTKQGKGDDERWYARGEGNDTCNMAGCLAWLDGQLPDDGRSRGSAAQAVGNQAYR